MGRRLFGRKTRPTSAGASYRALRGCVLGSTGVSEASLSNEPMPVTLRLVDKQAHDKRETADMQNEFVVGSRGPGKLPEKGNFYVHQGAGLL